MLSLKILISGQIDSRVIINIFIIETTIVGICYKIIRIPTKSTEKNPKKSTSDNSHQSKSDPINSINEKEHKPKKIISKYIHAAFQSGP